MTEIPKTQEEAAVIIGVKPSTLAMWRHKGRGPRYLKIGRSCFYLESDIEAWLDAQAVVPVPKEAAAS
jgi:predicted DNA-binding transcriptional regulator AlpA